MGFEHNERSESIVITGAARGIGRAVVERCAASGYYVFALDRDFADPGWRSVIGSQSASITELQVDLARKSDIESAFKVIANSGHTLRHLVNNAAIYPAKRLDEYREGEVEAVIAVNLTAAIHCTAHFLKILLAADGRGSIVNMTSVAGQTGSLDPVYGSTKAALIGLTKSLARSGAPGVRVNAIAPGVVTTEEFMKLPSSKIEEYLAADLLTPPISPEDVAATVAFLLEDGGRCYTGVVFDLNNGSYIR